MLVNQVIHERVQGRNSLEANSMQNVLDSCGGASSNLTRLHVVLLVQIGEYFSTTISGLPVHLLQKPSCQLALLERMGELVSCKQRVSHCQCKLRLSLFQSLHFSLACIRNDGIKATLAHMVCTTINPCVAGIQLSKAAAAIFLTVVGLSAHGKYDMHGTGDE